MIIPTPDYDPLFADDGVPFQHKMLAWIAREFSDILGPQVGLLQNAEGLEVLSRASFDRSAQNRRSSRAA